jgi:hypothetical protein
VINPSRANRAETGRHECGRGGGGHETHLEHGLHGVGDAGEPVPGLLGRRAAAPLGGLGGRRDGGIRDSVEERLDAAEQLPGVGGPERGGGAEAEAARRGARGGEGPRGGEGRREG